MELLLFENYVHSSSILSSKNNRIYPTKKPNVMYACNQEINYMIKYNENEDENE